MNPPVLPHPTLEPGALGVECGVVEQPEILAAGEVRVDGLGSPVVADAEAGTRFVRVGLEPNVLDEELAERAVVVLAKRVPQARVSGLSKPRRGRIPLVCEPRIGLELGVNLLVVERNELAERLLAPAVLLLAHGRATRFGRICGGDARSLCPWVNLSRGISLRTA